MKPSDIDKLIKKNKREEAKKIREAKLKLKLEKQAAKQAELLSKNLAKEKRLVDRAIKKKEKEAARAIKKAIVEKPESQIVQEYADTIIKKAITGGRLANNFDGMKQVTNASIWMDKHFYCSVVFQTESQKIEFIEKILEKYPEFIQAYNEDYAPGIINGLVLADLMGIILEKVESKPYPIPNLELRNLILDDEV